MLGSSAPFDIKQATAFLKEFLKVLGAAFFTVFTFVAGQLFMKFAEPAFELRKEIGTIAQDLETYANEDDRVADSKKSLEIFRGHASKLHGIVSTILVYWSWHLVFRLPKNKMFSRLANSFTACRTYKSKTGKTETLPLDRMPRAFASESFWKSDRLRMAKRAS
jgi:hypothetical protein